VTGARRVASLAGTATNGGIVVGGGFHDIASLARVDPAPVRRGFGNPLASDRSKGPVTRDRLDMWRRVVEREAGWIPPDRAGQVRGLLPGRSAGVGVMLRTAVGGPAVIEVERHSA